MIVNYLYRKVNILKNAIQRGGTGDAWDGRVHQGGQMFRGSPVGATVMRSRKMLVTFRFPGLSALFSLFLSGLRQ